MRRFDKLESADLEVSRVGRVSDSRQWRNEDRLYQPEFVGFHSSAQRDLVAGVGDRDLDPRLALRARDQASVFLTAGRF